MQKRISKIPIHYLLRMLKRKIADSQREKNTKTIVTKERRPENEFESEWGTKEKDITQCLLSAVKPGDFHFRKKEEKGEL